MNGEFGLRQQRCTHMKGFGSALFPGSWDCLFDEDGTETKRESNAVEGGHPDDGETAALTTVVAASSSSSTSAIPAREGLAIDARGVR